MKNAKLIDNSHISGSSESEMNKMLKSNNSLRRFNNEHNYEEITEKNIKKNNKELSDSNTSKIEPYALKFLNQTVKENDSSKLMKAKENSKSKFNTPNDKPLNIPNKIFKISLNPFPTNINKKPSISNGSNYILVKNPSSQKIKVIPQSSFGKLKFN